MKPIETRYAGCRFRSRLEARWAVFFDQLGLHWEYEPQGFETPAGRYLPDFHLTDVKQWIEVKGGQPSVGDVARCTAFALEINEPYFVFGDVPRQPVYGKRGPLGIQVDKFEIYHPTGNTSHPLLGIVEGGDVPPDYHYFGHPAPQLDGMLICGYLETWWLPWDKLDRLASALKAARGARFEHGQNG